MNFKWPSDEFKDWTPCFIHYFACRISAENFNHLKNFGIHFEFENETSFAFPFDLTYYLSLYRNFHLEFSEESLHSLEVLG